MTLCLTGLSIFAYTKGTVSKHTGADMIYPDYMTLEDIAEFELDMARFDLDSSMEFDEINRVLREIYLDKLAAESEMLQFYNI
jgi:hypothetical protein